MNDTLEILEQARQIKAIREELIAELAALDALDAEQEGAL